MRDYEHVYGLSTCDIKMLTFCRDFQRRNPSRRIPKARMVLIQEDHGPETFTDTSDVHSRASSFETFVEFDCEDVDLDEDEDEDDSDGDGDGSGSGSSSAGGQGEVRPEATFADWSAPSSS
uniref:Uncharacterized protein n=1 Tax=Vespula pensylvanica TaxID=30213 RepID=A0A834NGB3_VESPE|nr:hypothetical protein H0235_013917 [Vespula pensylvanica]